MAQTTKIDLQRLRRKVAFDRFLARIFSRKPTGFFLKGGYAMELRLSTARATKDIDLTSLERIEDANVMNAVILAELRECSALDLQDFFLLSFTFSSYSTRGTIFPSASAITKSLLSYIGLTV